MKKNFITSLLLIIAFLCGKYFEASREKEVKKQDPPRVFIEQLKTKMNIAKNRDDIEIFLNGVKMTEDVKIDIKK
jgi:hypothetical protein